MKASYDLPSDLNHPRSHAPRRCRAPRRQAFSYIEACIATVILSTAIVTGMNLYGSYARGAAMEIDREIGNQLAAEFLAEVLSKDFEEPDLPAGSFGREHGEDLRNDLDDVDDYHGWAESVPLTPAGESADYDIFGSYQRTITVRNVKDSDLKTTAAQGSSGAKLVRVVVLKFGRRVADLRGYRTRYEAP